MSIRSEMTALCIAPNRDLADQFTASAARTRSVQIVGDLKVYPSEQTLDIRLRQLRPDVVLIDVSSDLEVAADLIKFLTIQKPPVHVMALHTSNDSNVILRALRAGATEFLAAPFEISVQEAAISRIQKLLVPDQPSEKGLGKVVVFSSAKPGSGASTLAAQTAFALRRNTGKQVFVGDFDLTGGTLGFYLQLEQHHSLVDLLRHSDRLKLEVWSEMTEHAGGIDVLPAPEMPYPDPIDPHRLHEVIQFARMVYDWVIIDLPCVFQKTSLLTISESERAFLVSTSELASLHLARKAVKLLSQVGFDPVRYQVLINRLDKRDAINTSDLGKLFNCKVDATLPNDYFALHRVLTLGEPLEPGSELGRAIDGLAAKLCGAKENATPKGRAQAPRTAFSLS